MGSVGTMAAELFSDDDIEKATRHLNRVKQSNECVENGREGEEGGFLIVEICPSSMVYSLQWGQQGRGQMLKLYHTLKDPLLWAVFRGTRSRELKTQLREVSYALGEPIATSSSEAFLAVEALEAKGLISRFGKSSSLYLKFYIRQEATGRMTKLAKTPFVSTEQSGINTMLKNIRRKVLISAYVGYAKIDEA
eukprot:jgi/Bigna1/126791/aug1.3_g1499